LSDVEISELTAVETSELNIGSGGEPGNSGNQ